MYAPSRRPKDLGAAIRLRALAMVAEVYRHEALVRDPERVANARVDRERSLCLPCRLGAPHLAFRLPSALLVGHLGPVVLVPSGSSDRRPS